MLLHPLPPPYVQAYGARAYRRLGVYLQRAQLICWALCLPVAALWLNVSRFTRGWGWGFGW